MLHKQFLSKLNIGATPVRSLHSRLPATNTRSCDGRLHWYANGGCEMTRSS